MPTNPNMVAIQTVTVGAGGASTIEFTNIPQTYTDLVVLVSARTNRGTFSADTLTPVFNGSTANFTMRVLSGDGASASSNTSFINAFSTNVATASTFGNTIIYIPNYTSSNNKSISVDGVSETNATTSYMSLAAGLWSQTAAITSFGMQSGTSSTFQQYSTATLYGVTSAGYGAKATGGIITQDANYFYHTFLSSGTFTPTSNITADYLVVAGGGPGGLTYGAGGGAGGLRCTVTATGGGGSLESALSLTNGTAYTITVGGGGARSTAKATLGTNGSNSSISGTGITTITSTGGGAGANGSDSPTGATGGSGGGSGFGNNGAAGTANQGYAGGNSSASAPNYGTGGGGGAGAVGGNGTSTTGGNGGNGVTTSISGTSVTYAGGGGGGTYQGGTAGNGGTGGGGNAGATSGTAGTAGTTNTGSGGGGGSGGQDTTYGGAGGSGIVIVRYAK